MRQTPPRLIDLVAPSAKTRAGAWPQVQAWLDAHHLPYRFEPKKAFGDDPLFANSLEAQLSHFRSACEAEDSDFIWCYQGGYGASRLLPHLAKWPKPKKKKILMGSSDITALLGFVHHAWGWTAVHGPCAAGAFSEGRLEEETVRGVETILGEGRVQLTSELQPLNASANTVHLEGPLVGGNLTVLQYLFGTPWQIQTQGCIVILEDIDEPAYKTSLRLEQMRQLGLFDRIQALIFGTFTHKKHAAEDSLLTQGVLQTFTQQLACPVFTTPHVGHGPSNRPFVYGAGASLNLGKLSQDMHLC